MKTQRNLNTTHNPPVCDSFVLSDMVSDLTPLLPPVLGTCSNGHVEIDLARLMTTRLFIQATSGGGKSWALRRILEQTHGRLQQIVIDPEGELVTLAEKFDYVVCSPDSVDAPISISNGAKVAELIFRSGRSAIINVSEFDLEDMQDFVADFLRALLAQPQEYWHHLILAVDEAQLWCPQQDKASSKKPMLDIAARARKRGICPIIASQRASQVHKGLIAHLENQVIGLTTLDVDIKRVASQLDMALGEAKSRLRVMQPGEFLTYGPALSFDITAVKIGPVVTRHASLGAFDERSYRPAMSMQDLCSALVAAIPKPQPAKGAAGQASVASPSIAASTPSQPTSDVPPDSEVLQKESLRNEVSASRLAAIQPLLKTSVPRTAVLARARELGIAPAHLHRWLATYDPGRGVESLKPIRLRELTLQIHHSIQHPLAIAA